ncbi:uncharacterized protein BP5553_06801 [Venustampulla echinocandica]|uniref:Xylanolytic transcriptional activator regulatory domain-containing protein n=1 Tax=Venustampulla echinocandica TaxID=2656787 RepID=A0A370TKY7_9HELO|nr:uncharacterized protein BP5553_06801 [Venustampulla echinocandica]RDL36189.1 hypothetical protein BP5553_06801 [Venustampulla echinocandica]
MLPTETTKAQRSRVHGAVARPAAPERSNAMSGKGSARTAVASSSNALGARRDYVTDSGRGAIERARDANKRRRAGAACLPVVSPRRAQNQASSSRGSLSVSVHASGSLLSRTAMLRLLDAYFNGPHNFSFFAFLHRPTFMQMLDHDLIPRCLLLIVLATVKRIQDPLSRLADSWADESRQLVVEGIFTKISTSSLQTLLLLQRYEELRGDHLKAWFLSGLAIRLAHALQLNMEPLQTQRSSTKPPLPVTVMEVRRRLMWSCLVMDSMMEGGARPLTRMRISSIDIRLPCDETEFHLGRDTTSTRGVQSTDASDISDINAGHSRDGISACSIKAAMLRMQIIDYVFSYHLRNKDHLPSELPWQQDAQFYKLQMKLDQFVTELPIEFRFDHNALYSLSHGELMRLLNLHCLLEGAYCDLLRIGALLTLLTAGNEAPLFPEPPAWFLDTCARGLLDHAFAMAQVISGTMRHLASDCDPFAAICSCLATRLLVIDRRPEDTGYVPLSDPTVRGAIDGAVQCAKSVARWSVPARKYLNALSSLSANHGYEIDLADMSSSSLPALSRPVSRAASPSLRTYGTFGTIQRNLTIDADEPGTTTAAKQDQNGHTFPLLGVPTSGVPIVEEPALAVDNGGLEADYLLQPYDPLSPEALRIAAGWADGTFDLTSAEALFDWTAGNFAPDFGNGDNLFSAFNEG